MPQETQTIVLMGGLNLVTPPIAIPPGHAIAALNYEPDVNGYSRMGGYERYNGRQSPSSGADAAEMEALRVLIEAVPGEGPVRGVWAYDGTLWSFRDKEGGDGAMYKATPSGWQEQSFGYTIRYTSGTSAFAEGDTLTGGTSAATATVERVIIRSGAFNDGDAAGYLVLSNVAGAFDQAETITSNNGGSATSVAGEQAVRLPSGGRYEFTNNNFYGAAFSPRMYFANGVGNAFEWDGTVLAPIETGTVSGDLDILLHSEGGGGEVLTADGDNIIFASSVETPSYISHFRNHLFVGFAAGAAICSGIGEPLDYRAIAGALEFNFGEEMTGMLPAGLTSLVMTGRSRIEYIAGNDSSDFQMLPISGTAGALAKTARDAGDSPIYLDDSGIRKLATTAAFGDWRLGTLSQLVEPLIRRKLRANIAPTGALVAKQKDQYRLFFEDRSGLFLYLGRKQPEILPFLLPIEVFCACRGELSGTIGDRMFVGATDGFVYEIDSGTSFDGQEVQAYIRLAWNSLQSPTRDKRYHFATAEIDSPDDITVGVTYQFDYSLPGNPDGLRVDYDVSAGSESFIPLDDYDNIDWSQPAQGMLYADLNGIGRNMALTLVTEHTYEEPHLLSSLTVNFSLRKLNRPGYVG